MGFERSRRTTRQTIAFSTVVSIGMWLWVGDAFFLAACVAMLSTAAMYELDEGIRRYERR